MPKFRKIKIPTYSDARGNLSSVELKDYVNWMPRRIYYVTAAKGARGRHAVRDEKKLYICMQGAVKARIHDGKKWHELNLKGPGGAIVLESFCWREFTDFAPGTVLAAIVNIRYDKNKYIYDFEEFLKVCKK